MLCYNTFTTRWSGGTVRVWVQVQAPESHLAISLKAVPEGYRRFRAQNQRPSSWGRSLALLARVRRVSTNTGRFRVCGSGCWPRQARLRKSCYHSCNTDSVQESTRFLMLYKFQASTSHFFFHVKWNSIESVRCLEKLLPTKAAPTLC